MFDVSGVCGGLREDGIREEERRVKKEQRLRNCLRVTHTSSSSSSSLPSLFVVVCYFHH